MGYIVQAARDGRKFSYVEDDTERGYHWVEGDKGLLAAQRFRTQEAAGEVILAHRQHAGVLARIVVDSLAPVPKRQPRKSGFLIEVVGLRKTYYVALQDGVYRWVEGETGKARAFRFSSAGAAGKAILSGFRGVGGGSAQVIKVKK
jgi:hypothetical protein